MRVTEQIDALNTLGTDPIKKLVTPRVLAALIMLPVLTINNDFVGIVGGNLIATLVVGLDSSMYWRTVWQAAQCHQSQLVGFYEQLAGAPQEAHQQWWGQQTFYRAYSLVNYGRAIESDLFAGLR